MDLRPQTRKFKNRERQHGSFKIREISRTIPNSLSKSPNNKNPNCKSSCRCLLSPDRSPHDGFRSRRRRRVLPDLLRRRWRRRAALPRRLLARATPPHPQPLSDELSSYSGSSSYSATSGRSCVSDSTQRGRPVDPLRVLAVVASLRRIDPKVLAKATSKLVHGEAAKKRKGLWIEISDEEEEDADDDGDNSAVASEGSTITGTASAGSTATSGGCRRPPRASGGGENLPRRAESIMEWLSRPNAAPATETAIRAAVGDNAVTSKALRWLLTQPRGLRRTGNGGRTDPFEYMVAG